MEEKAQVKLVCESCTGCDFWILNKDTQRSALQIKLQDRATPFSSDNTNTLCHCATARITLIVYITHILLAYATAAGDWVSVSQAVHLKFHTPDSYTQMRLRAADCAILLLVCTAYMCVDLLPYNY